MCSGACAGSSIVVERRISRWSDSACVITSHQKNQYGGTGGSAAKSENGGVGVKTSSPGLEKKKSLDIYIYIYIYE